MISRLGIRAKLILASVVLMLVAGLAIERLGSRALEALMIERTMDQLAAELRLVEDAIELRAESAPPTGRGWDELCDRVGKRASTRVTLIAADGALVGDSDLGPDDVARAPNHGGREEVRAALEGGTGRAVRWSSTVGERMIYAAQRYPHPEQGVAVVRVAVPLTGVDATIARARLYLVAGVGAAIAAAIALSIFSAHLLTSPVRSLTQAALAMAGGDLAVHAPAHGTDETAQLGRALNRLSSELLAAIEQLRDERDLLANILDGMTEGVLVLDGDARIMLANRAMRTMTLIGEGAIGKSVIEIIRNATLQEALDLAAESRETVVREVELTGLMPRKLLVRVSKLPSRNGGRAERGLIAVFHDVTDLRRLETIRTDFVANVSHELRTPVTAISTAAETLLAGALGEPEEAAEFVDVIDRHAKRLRQLVDDLLDLSKIESKNFRLKLLEQDIGPVISHVARLLDEPAKRRRVDLRVERPEIEFKARIDRRAMEQVLMNLLDNAIKYAGEGAHVEVSTRAVAKGIEIRVADDGPGISPAHLGRIFERFYRVDAGRSRELGGTGLGLSIVKHLVELMNGAIDVESELGKGATFTVRLPRA